MSGCGSVARAARTLVTLPALLPLPGCLTADLWRPDPVVQTIDQRHAEFAVEAVAAAESAVFDSGTAYALVLRAHHTRGDELTATDIWLQLDVDGAQSALAIEDLLANERLGPIERCAIELEYTWTHQGERIWEGRIEVRGRFAPGLEGAVLDAAAARQLLAAATTVPADDPRALGLPRCVAAAESIDWRVLLPWADCGTGRVTACLLPQTECGEPAVGLESIDLLVQIGPDRWLRVPAAAMPALAAVERDPATLLGGFVLQTRCRPRPLAAAPRGFLAWSPPPDGTTLRLHSSAEEFTDSTGTLGRVLLTPLAAVADAAWWILKHGPFDFDLLRGDPCGARPVLAPIGAR